MAFHINDFANIAAYQTFISAHSELYPQLCLFKDSMTVSAAANADEDPYAPEPGPTPTTVKAIKFSSAGSQSLSFSDSEIVAVFEYSNNGTNWSSWDKTSIPFGDGVDLYIRGNNPEGFGNGMERDLAKFNFGTNASVTLSGNLMYLIDYTQDLTEVPCNSCFWYMFQNSPISDASSFVLGATVLKGHCYQGLFQGCTQLTAAPALPAENLADACYLSMFSDCTSLVTPPALPSMNIADQCYTYLFSGCTSLATAPALPATTVYFYCYRCMFQGCTSLTAAPDLPATVLENSCYYEMFSGCTNLASIKCLATDISANYCTENWVSGVAASGTFTKASSATWPSGVSGIPENWTTISE